MEYLAGFLVLAFFVFIGYRVGQSKKRKSAARGGAGGGSRKTPSDVEEK